MKGRYILHVVIRLRITVHKFHYEDIATGKKNNEAPVTSLTAIVWKYGKSVPQ